MTKKEFNSLKVGDRIRANGSGNIYVVSEVIEKGVYGLGVYGQARIAKCWKRVPDGDVSYWIVLVSKFSDTCSFKYLKGCGHPDNKDQKCCFKNCPIKK
jgi:hypothetical protein